RRVVGVARNRTRIVEIVEAKMQCAARRHGEPVWPDRFAIGEEDRDRHMRVAIGGVEDAGGLVRGEGAGGIAALGRDVALGDGPPRAPERLHYATSDMSAVS